MSLGDLMRMLLPRGGPEVECVMFPNRSATDSDYAFIADMCPDLKFFSEVYQVKNLAVQ